MDFCYRWFYWLAYRAARAVWFVTGPHHRGAIVALWHDGRLLVLRTSYRHAWCLPGGGIERGETALAAALREMREELGLALAPEALTAERSRIHFHDFRYDHTVLFTAIFATPPDIRIDRREIVAAEFMTPDAALQHKLVPALRDYLRATLATPADR